MATNKLSEKLKEGVSVKDIENFARHHTIEFFSVLAIIIATVTSCWDFFTGPKTTIFFLALGVVVSILFPIHVERVLKRLFNFALKQEKSTQMILGAVQIVVAIFIPFILFATVGLLAGGSFHYFIRHAEVTQENKPAKQGRNAEGDEHD